MILSKGGEAATESLPASVLQVFALLSTKKRSKVALASVAISILTTSFTMTIMSFDYDLSPKKRAANPEFYGFVRSDARMVTLALMFMFTCFQVLSKVFACGLMLAVDPQALSTYIAIDVGSMIVYKALRRELLYASVRFSPVTLALSIIQRASCKLLIDCSGYMLGRHPYEMGGAYWMFCVALTPVLSIASAHYYNLNSGKLGYVKLGSNTVWLIVGGINLLWVGSFVTFIRTIDPDYLHTFRQTMSGSQFTVNAFRKADTDEKKAAIFKRQFHVWKSIEGEVRTWVHANIAEWEKEKPEWYTKKLIQRIPEEVLTKDEMAMLISGGKKERRKSSIFEEVGLINAD
jgi:hypothetical protein